MQLKQLLAKADDFLAEKISPLSDKQKLGILLALIILPMIFFYILFYSPKNKELRLLNQQKTTLQNEIRKVEETVAQLDIHKQEKIDIEKKFEEASKLLPGEKEIPSLLDNISSLGTNSGLNVLSFKPKKEVPKQFYAEIPVEIIVNGPYHNVGVFLDKISKIPRIVTVTEVKMGSPEKQDNEMFLKTKLNLLTYRFIETTNVSNKSKTNINK